MVGVGGLPLACLFEFDLHGNSLRRRTLERTFKDLKKTNSLNISVGLFLSWVGKSARGWVVVINSFLSGCWDTQGEAVIFSTVYPRSSTHIWCYCPLCSMCGYYNHKECGFQLCIFTYCCYVRGMSLSLLHSENLNHLLQVMKDHLWPRLCPAWSVRLVLRPMGMDDLEFLQHL